MGQTRVGLAADRPTSAKRGNRYVASDTNQEWVGDGSEWIETTGGGGGGGSEIVALMRYFEQVDWATDDAGPTQIPGTLEVAGDGTRWARVTAYIPEVYVNFTTDGEAEETVRVRTLLGNEALTETYQEAELKLSSVTSGARDERASVALVALLEPWTGDKEIALHQVATSNADVMTGAAVGYTEPDYDKPISVVVEMFDAPAELVTGP